eukprot:g15035.t1
MTGPMKGALSNGKQATLKKNRGYGAGRLFYDKCYLSSDDDGDDEVNDGHGRTSCSGAGQALPAWTLSSDEIAFTVDGADDPDDINSSKKTTKKKAAKATATVTPSSGTKPLPLSSSSSRRASTTGSNNGGNRPHCRGQDPYELRAFSGEDDDQDDEVDEAGGDGDDDRESSEEEWEMAIASTKFKNSRPRTELPVPSTLRARPRTASAEPLKAAGKTAKAKPFSTRGSNLAVPESPHLPNIKPRGKAAAAAASSTGAGSAGPTPVRRWASPPASTPHGKGRGTASIGKAVLKS